VGFQGVKGFTGLQSQSTLDPNALSSSGLTGGASCGGIAGGGPSNASGGEGGGAGSQVIGLWPFVIKWITLDDNTRLSRIMCVCVCVFARARMHARPNVAWALRENVESTEDR
jgi:hypothetical protein